MSYQASDEAAASSTYSNDAFTQARSYDSDRAEAEAPQQASTDDYIKSGKKALRSPRGIARIVLFFLSLIAFACMASFPYYSNAGEFKFLLAMCVLSWLYSMGTILAYSIRKKIDAFCGYLPMVELVLDGFFLITTFVAACTCASLCNNDYSNACDYQQESLGAIAFCFLTSFVLAFSLALSWVENKRLERIENNQ